MRARVCVCVRALVRACVCVCVNKLTFISSDNHKGTLSRLLHGPEKGRLTLMCIYRECR